MAILFISDEMIWESDLRIEMSTEDRHFLLFAYLRFGIHSV